MKFFRADHTVASAFIFLLGGFMGYKLGFGDVVGAVVGYLILIALLEVISRKPWVNDKRWEVDQDTVDSVMYFE